MSLVPWIYSVISMGVRDHAMRGFVRNFGLALLL